MTDGERHAVLTACVLLAWCVSLWILGIAWWKAPTVAVVVAAAFAGHLYVRWIAHGSMVLFALAMAVWIEALPPPAQWKPMATAIILATKL